MTHRINYAPRLGGVSWGRCSAWNNANLMAAAHMTSLEGLNMGSINTPCLVGRT